MGLIYEEPDIQSSNLEPSRKRNHQEEQETPEHMECPRCGSLNTKFCYYNNYNKSQPRHLCKGCKRYWTKGGTLRDVPLGGGGRRKKKCRKLSNAATHKNIPSASSVDHNAPMSSSDSLISPQIEYNDDRTSNNFVGNNTFLGDNNGMFFLTSSQDQNKQFSCSDVSDFGTALPCFAASNQSLDAYGYTRMPDSSLDSTITTTMPMDGTNILSRKPCQYSFSSASMDLSSLWDWNQINSLISADLDVPWNDAELKFWSY